MARTPPELVAELVASYPRDFAKLTAREQQDTVQQYIRKLADVAPVVLERAVNELVCTEDWLPPLSKIRRVVAELALDLPSEGQALAQIEERMAWTRLTEEQRPPPPPVHPLVREALEHVGGFPALRHSEDPDVVRGQFGRYFREARARAIRDAQVAPLELVSAPQPLPLGQASGI